jgi:ribosomal protein S8E
MLATDAFRGLLSDRIRSIRNKNTNLVIIPSGKTSQLQLPDVSANNSSNKYT